MDARRRYRAPHADAFAALLQRRSLAGFLCEPMPPLEVHDLYLDTEGGGLLRQGLLLRLREHGGSVSAALRRIEGDEDIAAARFREPLPDGRGPVNLPKGELRQALAERIGDAVLRPLLRFRQYRTPRALYDGERLAGVLSLDVLSDESAGEEQAIVLHEVEVELVRDGRPADLARLDEDLQALGFEQEPYAKFENGLLRLSRAEGAPLYLLPRERADLEARRAAESAVERRRAELILLAADGMDTRAVSAEVGLSPSRVRHWRHAFRSERMRIFDPGAPEPSFPDEEKPAPRTFRVTELFAVEEEHSDAPAHPLEGPSRGAGNGGCEARTEGERAPESTAAHPVPQPPDAEGTSQREVPPEEASPEEAPPEEAGPEDGPQEDGPGSECGDREGLAAPAGVDGHETREEVQNSAQSALPAAEGALPGEVSPGPPADSARLPSPSADFSPTARARADETSAPKAPSIPSHDPVLERLLADVAARELRAAAARLRAHAPLGPDTAPDVVRALTEVTRTLPAALGLFADALASRETARARREAAALFDRLTGVCTLDRAIAAVAAPPDDSASLPLAIAQTVWSVARRRALEGHDPLVPLAERLDALADGADGLEPLAHVLAPALWSAYAALCRALDAEDEPGGAAPALATLAYLVSHAPPGQVSGEAVGRAQTTLRAWREANELGRHLEAVTAEWVQPGGAADPAPLVARREEAAAAARAAGERLSEAFRVLLTPAFRQALGQTSAAVWGTPRQDDTGPAHSPGG